MKLDGIKSVFKELPTTLSLVTNILYIIKNQFNKDIDMWVKCSDDTNVLLYATEGESQTSYNKP